MMTHKLRSSSYFFLLLCITAIDFNRVSAKGVEYDIVPEDELDPSKNGSTIHKLIRQDISMPNIESRQALLASGLASCTSSSPVVQSICNFMVPYIDRTYSSSALRITAGQRLYNMEDRTVRSVPTGHSCSYTSQIRYSTQYAYSMSSVSLRVYGNAFRNPVSLATRVPARVAARIIARDNFGIRIWRSCKRYGRDTYVMSGNDPTFANIVMSFSLAPKIYRIHTKLYMIVVEPKASIMFDLDKPEPRLTKTGKSKIASWYAKFIRSITLAFRAVDKIFHGKSLQEAEKKALTVELFKLAVQFIIGAPTNLDVAKSLVGETLAKNELMKYVASTLVKSVISRVGEKRLNKLLPDQEDVLNDELKRIFGLSNGQKRFYLRVR